jgi:hypothetical protein
MLYKYSIILICVCKLETAPCQNNVCWEFSVHTGGDSLRTTGFYKFFHYIQWNSHSLPLIWGFPSFSIQCYWSQVNNTSVKLPQFKILFKFVLKSTAPQRNFKYRFHCSWIPRHVLHYCPWMLLSSSLSKWQTDIKTNCTAW